MLGRLDPQRISRNRPAGRGFQRIPILLYFSVALSLAGPCFTENTSEIVDVAGTGWNAHDLCETTAIFALFTMVFTSVLALFRLVADTPSQSY